MGTKAIRATSLVKNNAEKKEINTSIIPVFRVFPLPLPRSFPERKARTLLSRKPATAIIRQNSSPIVSVSI